ncbi:MAG: hypothetical protein VKJ85_05800 [Prochlorothrix sp.]|nr:hypothetical protein [Prochlorothrix sp.]
MTGTAASGLPGTLKTSHPANLFFLNPNGINMDSRTRLDIGGSFFASTGDRLIFEDGSYFSAGTPNSAPLLVVNPPTALWMGENSGSMTVEGSTHGLFYNGDFSINRSRRSTGLEVSPGQVIQLVGNGISFDGANVAATQGTIEVASLAAGTVQIQTPTADSPWSLAYNEAESQFSPIRFSSSSAIEVSGPGGGNLALQGSRIDLQSGSVLLADTLGSEAGGVLRVRGTEAVTVEGTRNGFTSGLFAAVDPGVSGQGGRLEVVSPLFRTANGAIIGVDTFGSGNAGVFQVQGGRVEVDRADWSVQSFGQSTGRGGRIDLDIDTLQVVNGAQILAQSLGSGSAGEVRIKAKDSIFIQGERIVGNGIVNSVITTFQGSNSRGSGQVVIETGSLTLQDGGRISMSSRSRDASLGQGSLVITARDFIDVIGTSSNGAPSLITTTAEGQIKGNNITITTPYLTARQGGQISTGTTAAATGGDLTLTVGDTLTLEGRSAVIEGNNLGEIPVFKDSTGLWFPSGLLAGSTGAGAAGTLTVKGGTIALRDRAELTVSGEGSGNAGNLILEMARIQLQGGSQIRGDTRAGAGNIQIASHQLSLRDNSSITTNALGQTLGSGNITVQVGSLSLDRSVIASDTEGGLAGNVSVTATQWPGIQLNQGRISANGGLGNVSLNAPLLSLTNQSLVSTNGQGTTGAIDPIDRSGQTSRGGGNIQIQSTGSLSLRDSAVTANAQNSNGGSIRLVVPDIDLDQASAITTNVAGITTDSTPVTSGGDIGIRARILRLNRASEISSNTTVGAAGNIYLEDLSPETPLALFLNQSQISATGGAGNLSLSSQGTVSLFNQSRLNADGQGTQGGGRIGLRASRLVADASTISANVLGRGVDSGQINLNLGSLVLQNNSAITSDAPVGSAGDVILNLTADGLVLDQSRITATGGSGNLQIQSPALLLRNASFLSTNGQGSQSGGSISATVGREIRLMDSNMTANADNSFGGQVNLIALLIQLDRSAITTNVLGTEVTPGTTGGNITITGGSLYFYDRSQVASNAAVGGAGNISLTATAPNTIRLRNSQITATGGLGNLSLRSVGNIELLGGSLISTNGQGSQPGGNITIDTDGLLLGLQNSDITANAQNSAGGRVMITAVGLLGIRFSEGLTDQSDITATSDLGPAFQGIVTLDTPDSQVDSGLAELPQAPPDPSNRVIAACPAAQGNRFSVVGPGGIPESPLAPLRSIAGWQDLQNALLLSPTARSTAAPLPLSPSSSSLVEANTWVADAQGNVRLTAQNQTTVPALLTAACR